MKQIFNGTMKQTFTSSVRKEAKRIADIIPTMTGKKVVYKLPKLLANKGWEIVDCLNCILFKYDANLKRDALDPSYYGEITIYPERLKQLEEKNKAVSDELDRLISEMDYDTELDKARAIAEKVCEVFEYCHEKDRKGQLIHSDTYSYDLVIGKCGVCSGYAKLFCMLCDKLGLQSQYLDNTDHAWNRVKVNGQWLYVDCTWDDLGDRCAFYFTLKQKKQFAKDHSMHKRIGWDCWMFKEV